MKDYNDTDYIVKELIRIIEENDDEANSKKNTTKRKKINVFNLKMFSSRIKSLFNNKSKTLNKKNLYIAIATGIVVFALFFIFLIRPAIVYKNALNNLANGEYEKAYERFSKVNDYKDSNELLDIVERKIASECAEYLLDNYDQLKNDNLQFVETSNVLIHKEKESEDVTCDVTYSNLKYKLVGKYYVQKKIVNNEWQIMNYNELEKTIYPLVEIDREIIDEKVDIDYQDSKFIEEQIIDPCNHLLTYSYEHEDKAGYLTNYKIIAKVLYDKGFGKWNVESMEKNYVDTKKIPYKEIKTANITISVPETWKLLGSENEKSFYYSFNISDDYYTGSLWIDLYEPSFYNPVKEENARANHGLGAGKYSVDGESIQGTYYPYFNDEYMILSIGSNNLDKDLFDDIIKSLKLKKHSYFIKVNPDTKVNIRNTSSILSGDVVGKAKAGKTFTSKRAYYSQDYTWYEIGESQWVADNGEWLTVTVK